MWEQQLVDPLIHYVWKKLIFACMFDDYREVRKNDQSSEPYPAIREDAKGPAQTQLSVCNIQGLTFEHFKFQKRLLFRCFYLGVRYSDDTCVRVPKNLANQ